MEPLASMFAPARVAVVGATDRRGAVGRAVLENLLETFEGDVVPVNPNRASVLDRACVPSLARAGPVDLAVLVVPAEVVVDVIAEADAAGVDHVVVITAGFEEAGREGARRSRALAEALERSDVTLVGPNSLGIMSTPVGLNATFAPRIADRGPISFMSQSGAFITAVLDWARDQRIGFRHVVSLGNKLDIDEAALLEAWGADPGTEAIIGYLESVPDGRAFMAAAERVSRDTPVVLVKSGRTDAGAQAASSHTGAMAGSDAVIEAAFRQAGVVRAETASALFDAADLLAGQPVPAGSGLGIVSNAGGPAVLATDATADTGLRVASLGDETVALLTERLPSTADPYNPVDVIGDADVERFRTAMDAVALDDAVDALLVLSAPVATMSYRDLAAEIGRVQATHGLPVAACLMGGREATGRAVAALRERSIPNYFDPARAVQALGALDGHRRYRERPTPTPSERTVDRADADAVIDAAVADDRRLVGLEALDLLGAYGIDTPPGELAMTSEAAVDIARGLGGDAVVMKVVSPDLTHKTDVGGVRVGVPVEAVADTYEDIVASARSYRADADLLGVYVQAQLDLSDAVEVIVGGNRDPQFGPVVLFGLGGIFAELLEDVTLRVAPLDERGAQGMLEDIDAAAVLRGARGQPPVDRDAIADAILGVDRLLRDYPRVLELDINPLVATPDGARAVDVRLTLEID